MNTQIQGNWYNDSNGDCGYRSHYFFGSESLCNVTMLPTKHISYKKRCIKCLKSLETLKKIGPELYYSKSEYHSVKLGHKLKNKTKHKEFPLKTSNWFVFSCKSCHGLCGFWNAGNNDNHDNDVCPRCGENVV